MKQLLLFPDEIQKLPERKTTEKSRGIIYPCSIGRQYPIGRSRDVHCMNCEECKRLLAELDKIAHGDKK